MSESKELLEATIKGLEEKVNQLNNDLATKKKELEDVNKPEITGETYDTIQELVEESIRYFDFNCSENYDIEYDIDYDGRVNASSLEFNSTNEVTENIMNKIDGHFKISTSEDIK